MQDQATRLMACVTFFCKGTGKTINRGEKLLRYDGVNCFGRRRLGLIGLS